MKIQIQGLTPIQVWYLNILWTIDSKEELNAWKKNLRPIELNLVNNLQQILLMKVIDNSIEQKNKFPDVKSYLKKFMVQS